MPSSTSRPAAETASVSASAPITKAPRSCARDIRRQARGRFAGGDDPLRPDIDPGLAQPRRVDIGRPAGVVGDEDEVTTSLRERLEGAGGAWDQVPPDPDDAVEIDQKSVVIVGRRHAAEGSRISVACGWSVSTANGQVVVANDVSRRYGEGDAAVDALVGISTGFERGRFTAIMGPSGSGKSTLMHILAGLDRPTSGTVSLDGQEITGLDDGELTKLRRDKLGFVFQFFNLLPVLTAEENLVLPLSIAGRKPDREWLDQLIKTVGLEDRRTHRPSELSGGQQQRVAVARALVSKPAVVFADEPTGNLDSRSSADVLELLRRAVDEFGQTVIMVTHDPSAATHADRLITLTDGSIVHDAAPGLERRGDRADEADRLARVTRLAIKSLWARKVRALTTILAVVIGVAFVAGTYILTDTTFAAFDEIFSDSLKGTDVVDHRPQRGQTGIKRATELQRLGPGAGEEGAGGPARLGGDLHPGRLLRRRRATRSAPSSPPSSSPRACPAASSRSPTSTATRRGARPKPRSTARRPKRPGSGSATRSGSPRWRGRDPSGWSG